MKDKIKSTSLLFITAIIWGFAFVAQRIGADYVGPYTFNGIRFILGAVSLIPIIIFFEKEKLNKTTILKTVKIGVLAGIFLFLASTLQQYGVTITGSAGKAGFMTGLYTVMVPVIRFLGGRKTSILTFIGSFFAVAGLFLLCMTGDSFSFGKGDVILLLCAVFFSLHILVVDKFVNDLSPLKFSMVQFLFCGIISIVMALLTEDIQLSSVKMALGPLLYGGILSVGVAYTCQILGQKNADPTFASIILSTESVFGAVGEAIILKVTMGLRGYIGCAFMFVGIILSQLSFERIKKYLSKKQTRK